MIIHTMPSGDVVHRHDRSIVVKFSGRRSVISSGHINGGYREDLTAVYNHNADAILDRAHHNSEAAYREYMKGVTRAMGLDVEKTSALGTGVCMDNAVIRSIEYQGLHVTAIVTGGIDHNGGRVGDPASIVERNGAVMPVSGTINVILEINAKLPPHALARAIVTLTEAKTAAIQELMLGSCYSTGLATGSGTDQVIVIGNDESDLEITYVGKHAKAGELIGRAVKEAVTEALFRHSGVSPSAQHSALKRLKRFGVNEENLWETYAGGREPGSCMEKPAFAERLRRIDRSNELVTLTSLYVHLLDQADWGLIDAGEVRWAGSLLLAHIAGDHVVEDTGDLRADMLEAYAKAVSEGAAGADAKHV